MLLLVWHYNKAQQIAPYKNPTLPIDARVNDLLSRMTIEEKFWQLFMIPGEVKKGDEEKYKNGIFGFQVSASVQGNNAAQQMLHYNVTEDAEALAKKINATPKVTLNFSSVKNRCSLPGFFSFTFSFSFLFRAGHMKHVRKVSSGLFMIRGSAWAISL